MKVTATDTDISNNTQVIKLDEELQKAMHLANAQLPNLSIDSDCLTVACLFRTGYTYTISGTGINNLMGVKVHLDIVMNICYDDYADFHLLTRNKVIDYMTERLVSDFLVLSQHQEISSGG